MNQLQGKTNSKIYNDNFLEVKEKLDNAFSESEEVLQKLESFKKLNNSSIETMKRQMTELTDKIEALTDTSFLLSNNYIYKESFRDSSSFETDLSFYKNKRGVLMDSSYTMKLDKVNQCLTMPTYISTNKLLSKNGTRLCKIEISKQLGSGLINIKNPNNDIYKAIDTSLDTYWEETILCDSPIRIALDDYEHYFGALCELTISFQSVTEFNEIVLVPFGNYPINVNSLKFYLGNEKISEITNYNFMIKKETSISFPLIKADKIIIVLNQRHYIRNAFLYDIADKTKNEIWFANDKEIVMSIPYEGVYTRELKDKPSYFYFNEVTKPLFTKRNLDIESFLFPDSKIVHTTKYEYSYGLYNLEVKQNGYKNLGIYVSKPIKYDFNIGSVTFNYDEQLVGSDYVVSYFLNFGNDIWHEVYSGTTLYISELMEDNTTTETFLGTHGKSLTLKYKPVFCSKTVNSFIEVNLKKEGITTKAIDKTNYNNLSSSFQKMNYNSDEISFYFYQDKIYFNKEINQDTIIEVTYKYFIDSVRVKIIMERIINGDNSITPTINNYSLTFKSIC